MARSGRRSEIGKALALVLAVVAASACDTGGDDPGATGGSGGVVGTGGTGGDPGTGGTGGDPGTGGTGGDPGTGGTGGDPGTGGTGGNPGTGGTGGNPGTGGTGGDPGTGGTGGDPGTGGTGGETGTGGTGGDPLGPVVRVEITSSSTTLVEFAHATLVATAFDAEDREVTGSAVLWRSSNPSVVDVTSLGEAFAIAAGSATITATIDGIEGEVKLTVTPGVVSAVHVDGPPGRISVGDTFALVARAVDSQARVLVGRMPTWSSSDPAVATVDASGTLTALSAGVATITAQVDGVQGQAQVEVLAPVAGSRLAMGSWHTCHLDDAGAAWCWGANDFGQLGDGSYVKRESPVASAQGLTFRSLTAGEFTTCGLTDADEIYCWGSDYSLQLGGVGDSTSPALVSAGPHSFLMSMHRTNCTLSPQGRPSCWGFNSSEYEFGNGSTTASSAVLVPVLAPPGAPPLSFVDMKGGWYHACGLTAGSHLYCWGYNALGQVGVGHMDRVEHAMPLFPGQAVDAFGVGDSTSCATTGGTSYCWGAGSEGQVGHGAFTSPQVPTPIASGGAAYTTFAGGTSHMCALDAAGAAWCWGRNLVGQLGRPGGNSNTPVAVSGNLTFTSIFARVDHTCGITDTGAVYCWGFNFWGQLGIGTSNLYADTPTLVQW